MGCGVWTSFPADAKVQSQINQLNSWANNWSLSAESNLTALGDLMGQVGQIIEQPAYNFALNLPENFGADFQRVTAPEEPDFGYTEPQPVSIPGDASITPPSVGTVPSFTGALASLDWSGAPGSAPDTNVGDPPAIIDPTLPTYTAPADPVLPSLRELQVPAIAPLTLDAIDINVPVGTFGTISPRVDYTDPGLYTSTQLTKLTTEVSRVLNGDLGIPDYLWDQIYHRDVSRHNQEQRGRERRARLHWGSQGWDIPGIKAFADTEAALQAGQDARSEQSRSQAVQEAVQKREDFWQAVQQGVALETLQGNLQHQMAGRLLQVAIADTEAQINGYNALVGAHNALVNGAQARAAEARLKLERSLARLEEDKLRLEAAKTAGILNEQDINVYVAQWEGIKQAVEVYKAQLEGVETVLDAQKLKLESHGQKIQNATLALNGWATAWDGYGKKTQAQLGKVQAYRAEAGAFGEIMGAFRINADVERDRVNAEVEIAKLRNDRVRLDMQRYAEEWRGITGRLGALAGVLNARSSVFGAEVGQEEARVRTDDRRFQIAIEEGKLDQNAAVEAARLQVQKILQLVQVQASSLQELGRIYASLVSAAYSAAHVSASTSASIGDSTSCSETYAF